MINYTTSTCVIIHEGSTDKYTNFKKNKSSIKFQYKSLKSFKTYGRLAIAWAIHRSALKRDYLIKTYLDSIFF